MIYWSGFANPKSIADGGILIPESPINLQEALDSMIETEEEQEESQVEGLSAHLLGEDGWSLTTLVGFYWYTMMPMVWEQYLRELSHPGHGTFAVLYQDECDPFVLARLNLENGVNEADVYRILFEKLIEDNGAALNSYTFGSIPSNTDNMVEHLIPEDTVRECYWNWMLNWKESDYGEEDLWRETADEVRARQGDPIGYFKGSLARAFESIFVAEKMAQNPEAGKPVQRLSERAKRAIFDAYFDISYGPY